MGGVAVGPGSCNAVQVGCVPFSNAGEFVPSDVLSVVFLLVFPFVLVLVGGLVVLWWERGVGVELLAGLLLASIVGWLVICQLLLPFGTRA